MFEYKEAASLKLGDTVRCLKCREEITLTPDTFKLNSEMEYIECPHCYAVYDVFSYLYAKMYGEEVAER